jgi:hypothetical protein
MRPTRIWLLFSLALAGCSSPQGKFQTQVDPAYHGKLERVLVFYFNVDTTTTLGRDFSDRFVTRLAALLLQRNVPSEVVRLERSALDRDAPVKAAAARFRPRQYFTFGVTRVNASAGVHRALSADLPQFQSDMSASLEFSLMDAQNGRTVWRATGFYYAPPHAEDVADQVMGQLAAGHFL